MDNANVNMPEEEYKMADDVQHLNHKENQIDVMDQIYNNGNSTDNSNCHADDDDDDEKDLTNLTWLTECNRQTISLINLSLDDMSDNVQQQTNVFKDNKTDHLTIYPSVINQHQSDQCTVDLLKKSQTAYVNNNCNSGNCNQIFNGKYTQRNNKKQSKTKANSKHDYDIPLKQSKTWQATPIQRYEMFINKIKKDLEVYQQSVIDYQIDVSSKPPFNYSHIIGMAMLESGRSTLRQICTWIERKFAFFRTRKKWNNSIRHNLSLHPCFRKISRKKEEKGKGGYWELGIDDGKINRKRIRHRRTKDRDNNKKPLRYKQKLHLHANKLEESKQLQTLNQMNDQCILNDYDKFFVIDLIKDETGPEFLKMPRSDCKLDTIIIRASPSISTASASNATDVFDLINTDFLKFSPFVNPVGIHKIKTCDKQYEETCRESAMSSSFWLASENRAYGSNSIKTVKSINDVSIMQLKQHNEKEQQQEQQQQQQQQQQEQEQEHQNNNKKFSDGDQMQSSSINCVKNALPIQIVDNDNNLSYIEDFEEPFRYLRNIHNNCCDDNLFDNIIDVSVNEL